MLRLLRISETFLLQGSSRIHFDDHSDISYATLLFVSQLHGEYARFSYS